MVVWNLRDILPQGAQDFDRIVSSVESKVQEIEVARPRLSEKISNEEFRHLLFTLRDAKEALSRLGAYGYLSLSENTADPGRNAFVSKVEQTSASFANRLLFFSLWWKGLSDASASRLKEGLGDVEYFLDSLRRFKQYTLGENEEQIINLKDITGSSALSNIYDIITNAFTFKIRLEGKLTKMGQEELITYVRHPDPKMRKQAYMALLKKYRQHRSVLGEIYRSLVLDWQNEGLTLRGYKTSMGMRNLANDIPDRATDALLSVCDKNVGVFKKYFDVKNKLCGIEKPTRFDLYAPYQNGEKKYSFDEAKTMVLATLRDFSPRMHDCAKQVFDENHIHADVTLGKRSGAYCYSLSPSITPYVMINFNNTPSDVSTLAHEIGHAVHALLARDKSYFTFHAPLPLAETASIFSEMLLTQRLLKTADKKTKTGMLVRQLDQIYASVCRQSFFVLFEKDAHEAVRKGATLDDLDKLWMTGLHKQFRGSVNVSSLFAHEWLYIPHIFQSPFYCYAYAFGNLLVLALYRMYAREGDMAVDKILKILSYGGSKAPAQILEEVGIDITRESFWQSGFDVIAELVDELRSI